MTPEEFARRTCLHSIDSSLTHTGAVEAACWLRTGVLPKLSVQEIIDCSWEQGNEGCATATQSNVLKYIGDYGLIYSEDYPYESKDQMCKTIFDMAKLCLKRGDLSRKDVIRIEPNDLGGLLARVQKGPIVVLVNAETREWQSYTGGILESFPCRRVLKHTVPLVGYGVDNGRNYWTIRSSYGTGWGEGGYARIIRDPKVKHGAGFCNLMYYSAMRVSFKGPLSPGACRKGDLFSTI